MTETKDSGMTASDDASSPALRGKEETPKPACVVDGEPWWNFLYEYDWEGKTYCFEICARSQSEADARLKRLPLARYKGQADGNPIPMSRGGWLVPLIVWWRNLGHANR